MTTIIRISRDKKNYTTQEQIVYNIGKTAGIKHVLSHSLESPASEGGKYFHGRLRLIFNQGWEAGLINNIRLDKSLN